MVRERHSYWLRLKYRLWWLPLAEIRYSFLYGWTYLGLPSDKRRAFRNRKKSQRKRKKYPAGFRNNKPGRRKALIKRDGQICNICKKPKYIGQLTIDHVVQVSRGGSSDLENLQLLCRECHIEKDSPEKIDYTEMINETDTLKTRNQANETHAPASKEDDY